MKLNEFFDHLDVTEAPKRFPEGHYTHTPGALEVMPTQDQTLWADAGELPKKFNVTKMKIAIYDEGDDEDPYSYGNGGLLVYHNAGTWKMYTDDVTRVQIADYLGIPTKDIDFSEQGMQDEGFMHFDIEDDAVAELISKGAFKLEETAKEEGVQEDDKELKIPLNQHIPLVMKSFGQLELTKQLRKRVGLPKDAPVYFDDADLVYGDKTVWPGCAVDEKCTFGDAVKALKKFVKANPLGEDDVDAVYPGTGDIYGYTWDCKKCGTENEFSMSRQDAQEYINDWEADNEDLVADGETGSAALTDTLAQGEDSGFHYGTKCKKCGTEAKDPYSESINDIIRLSGLK